MLGVSVWIGNALVPGYSYPAKIHSQLMMGAFLFAFAAGFLMTAIPKMTASFPAEPRELVTACALTLGTAICATLDRAEYFYLVSTISILALVVFFVRRFLARTKAVPPFFPFVIFGLLAGLTGSAILGVSQIIEVPSEVSVFGGKIYFEGMILYLVLGIASRLMPVITGRGVLDQPGTQPVRRNIVLACSLLLSFGFEAVGQVLAGGILKVLVVGWVAYAGWGLFSKSKTKSRLALGMRLAGLMILFGLIMTVVQPSMNVHWVHLTYIAGFGLMTLTVATRVTLAHGSYDLVFETRSNALWICGALILTAALARVGAPFTGSGYFMHLLYSAVLWILAIGVWSTVFLKRIFWKGEDAASC